MFLGLWELAVRNDWWLDSRLIASPWESSPPRRLRDREVWEAVWTTTVRMFKGFVVGTVLGWSSAC